MSSTKDHILKSVRENTPGRLFPYPTIPAFTKSIKPILDEFKENLVIGAGTWYDVANEVEIASLIEKIHPDAKVICSVVPEVKGNKDLSRVVDPHELADVDVGVIRARFGVSENGMVWVTESVMHINALGFLSQHLVILLDPDQMVRDMYEAYARIDLQKDNYGCFMLGPSATADIGAYMVRGAQGARTLTVLFI